MSAERVPAGVVVGTWSRIGADGVVIVPVGAAKDVHVTTFESTGGDVRLWGTKSLGTTVYLPDAHAYVLPEEAASRYGVPRVLVPRWCCGWDWVGTREAYIRSRTVMQPCVVFHTPSHNTEFLELPGEGYSKLRAREAALVAEAEQGWLVVADALGEPR